MDVEVQRPAEPLKDGDRARRGGSKPAARA
jgi:hypothetical protein